MARVIPFALRSRRFDPTALVPSRDSAQLMQFLDDVQIVMLNRPAAFDVLSSHAQQFANNIRQTLKEAQR